MKTPNIETAVRIYHENTELSNAKVSELFGGNLSSATCSRLKKTAKAEMMKRNIHTCFPHNVNTKVAYEVWKLDIDDLERRLKKLTALNLRDAAA